MKLDIVDTHINYNQPTFYKDGLPFTFSAWVSPNRKECYHKEVIILSNELDAGDTNTEFFCEFYPTSIFDLFESTDRGLFYITGIVHSEFTTDYYGEVEHEFVVDKIINKDKCMSYAHLKEMYRMYIKEIG